MTGTDPGTVLSFDLGGTKLHSALVGADGRVQRDRLDTTPGDKEAILSAFRRAAAELLAGGEGEVAATAVGTAGTIRRADGAIQYTPNLPLDGFPLGTFLADFCPGPVTVLNDGRAAALGEYAFGRLRGVDPMICLFFGTGIGIGTVIDGRLLAGHDNSAGEVGHTIYRAGGPRCNCGKQGCFEAFCGGGPMTVRARAEIGPPPGGGEKWSVGGIVAAARAGEAGAWGILAEALEAFQVLTANVVTLCNPGALVLGGGVLQGWPELFDLVRAGLERLVHPTVRKNLQVAPSELGSRAILLGAAAAALESAGGARAG